MNLENIFHFFNQLPLNRIACQRSQIKMTTVLSKFESTHSCVELNKYCILWHVLLQLKCLKPRQVVKTGYNSVIFAMNTKDFL